MTWLVTTEKYYLQRKISIWKDNTGVQVLHRNYCGKSTWRKTDWLEESTWYVKSVQRSSHTLRKKKINKYTTQLNVLVWPAKLQQTIRPTSEQRLKSSSPVVVVVAAVTYLYVTPPDMVTTLAAFSIANESNPCSNYWYI